MRSRIFVLVGSLLAITGGTCNPPAPIPEAELSSIAEKATFRESYSNMSATSFKSMIAIVSHSTLDIKYIPFAIDNHHRYAKKFGYDYIFRNGLISQRYLNPAADKKVFKYGLYWQKIAAVQEVLNTPDEKNPERKKYAYVMWIDADALFSNFETSIESVIQKWGPEKEFLIAKETITKVNAGVFIVKNTLWSRQMIENIAMTFDAYKNELLPEQQAIQDFLYGFIYYNARGSIFVTPMNERNYEDYSLVLKEAAILPQRVMNAFYKGCAWASGTDVVWEPGDYIAHFAVAFGEKEKLLTKLLTCFKEMGGEDYEFHQSKIESCI